MTTAAPVKVTQHENITDEEQRQRGTVGRMIQNIVSQSMKVLCCSFTVVLLVVFRAFVLRCHGEFGGDVGVSSPSLSNRATSLPSSDAAPVSRALPPSTSTWRSKVKPTPHHHLLLITSLSQSRPRRTCERHINNRTVQIWAADVEISTLLVPKAAESLCTNENTQSNLVGKLSYYSVHCFPTTQCQHINNKQGTSTLPWPDRQTDITWPCIVAEIKHLTMTGV